MKWMLLTCLVIGILLIAFGDTANAIKFIKNIKNDNKNQSCSKNIDDKDLELLSTISSKSDAKNQVWVGTFQLVWNDLTDELIKHPIEFVDYDSEIVKELNKKSFVVNDISEDSYYKKWGLVSPALKKEIEQGIKAKFNEKSGILDSFDWSPADKKYLLYAMLKKDFEFIEKLNKLERGKFKGSDSDVEYFGLNKNATYKQRQSVKVLFYNGQNDFAVQLKSKQNDVITLYRTNNDKTLEEYYSDLNKKTGSYLSYIGDEDCFKAPVLDFVSLREFEELCNKQIKGTDLKISRAIETIQFKMDEAGVKLKSEAAIGIERGGIPQYKIMPRYFYFDDKYVIFISEENKNPYFAMKVADAAVLQK